MVRARGPCTCCNNAYLNRGPWTPEEDALLTEYIKQRGDKGNWRKVPRAAGLLRCGKSCRLRWLNYLRPDIKRGKFSDDETNLIIQLHELLGNRWSIIAGRVPGRSDNEIKNYWNFHLSKRLLSMGIDPKNHKPLIHRSIDLNSSRSNKGNSNLKPQERFYSFYSRNSSFSSTASSFETSNASTSEDKENSNESSECLEENKLEILVESRPEDHAASAHGNLEEPLPLNFDEILSPDHHQELDNPRYKFNLDFLDGPIYMLESDSLLDALDAM